MPAQARREGAQVGGIDDNDKNDNIDHDNHDNDRGRTAGADDAVTSRHPGYHAYWITNLKLIAGLLAVWFIVSFGFGILLVEPLNRIDFFGFPLGFWWAQQGAIFVFVVLVFVYAAAMKRIDRHYGVSDDDETP